MNLFLLTGLVIGNFPPTPVGDEYTDRGIFYYRDRNGIIYEARS